MSIGFWLKLGGCLSAFDVYDNMKVHRFNIHIKRKNKINCLCNSFSFVEVFLGFWLNIGGYLDTIAPSDKRHELPQLN